MELPNITTRGSFPMIKKSHKAIMGALLVSERELVPFQRQKKTYWTLDFLVPPPDGVVDVTNALIFPDKKIQEMLIEGYLGQSQDHKGRVGLTRGGAFITEDCEHDWWWYWDHHFNSRNRGKKFNWMQYFKTGCYDLTI